MRPTRTSTSRAVGEAADWHARLGGPSVTAAALDEFRLWRTNPDNAAAYRDIEALWRQSGALAGDPDIQAATREAQRAAPSRQRRFASPVIAGGLATACAVIALGFGVYYWSGARSVYATSVGEQRVIQLADGSTIRLDTSSRVRVRYDRDERRIELSEGQALFTVASDTSRPFTVAAGDTLVTAVGTVFDVRRDADGARVTLVEGVVDVKRTASAPAPSLRLQAGQQVRTGPNPSAPHFIDPAVETSWTQGRLVFRNTPLAQAVAETNRYLSAPIILEPGPAGAVEVNGVFASGDRDAFVAAVTGLFNLSAHPGARGAIVLSARDDSENKSASPLG